MELKQYNGLKGFFGISDNIEIADDEIRSEYSNVARSSCSAFALDVLGEPVMVETKDGRVIEGFKFIES